MSASKHHDNPDNLNTPVRKFALSPNGKRLFEVEVRAVYDDVSLIFKINGKKPSLVDNVHLYDTEAEARSAMEEAKLNPKPKRGRKAAEVSEIEC